MKRIFRLPGVMSTIATIMLIGVTLSAQQAPDSSPGGGAVQAPAHGRGVVASDLDNDGFVDLYITDYGRGVDASDFDNDGFVDFYIANGLEASLPSSYVPADKLSEYWLGLDGVAADATLRAQLGLPEGQGIVVNDVVADSPAAKAGLKQHDVLLTAGGKPLAQLSDLAQAVQEIKDKPLAVVLVRAGKRLTVHVTPQRRPPSQTGETCPSCSKLEDAEFARRIYLDVHGVLPTAEQVLELVEDKRPEKRGRLALKLLRQSAAETKSCTACHVPTPGHNDAMNSLIRQKWPQVLNYNRVFHNEGDGRFRELRDWMVQGVRVEVPQAAAIVESESQHELPDDVTISITRQGKQPAKVTVKKPDNTWETTEGELDQLPEDIRPQVQRMLRIDSPQRPRIDAETRLSVRPDADHATARDATKETATPSVTIEQVTKQLDTLASQIEELRKAMKGLQKSTLPGAAKARGEEQK